MRLGLSVTCVKACQRIMESAEVEYLRSLGLSVSMPYEAQHLAFPRVAASCDYMKPAYFEDLLDVEVRVIADGLGTYRLTREDRERMQAALLAASRVPLEVAETARRLLDACERGVASSSPMTASDIGVGALMAEAALRGAALNVMINLASVKDAAQVKAISEHLDRAVDGSDEQRRRITDFVESRIAR